MKKFKYIISPMIILATLFEIGVVFTVTVTLIITAKTINLPINSSIFWTSLFTVLLMTFVYILAYIASFVMILKNNTTGYLLSGIISLFVFGNLVQIWVQGHVHLTFLLAIESLFWIALIVLSFIVRAKFTKD